MMPFSVLKHRHRVAMTELSHAEVCAVSEIPIDCALKTCQHGQEEVLISGIQFQWTEALNSQDYFIPNFQPKCSICRAVQ